MRTCLVSYPRRTPRTLHPAEGRGTVLMTKMQEKIHVPSLRHYLPMRVEASRPHALQKALPSLWRVHFRMSNAETNRKPQQADR